MHFCAGLAAPEPTKQQGVPDIIIICQQEPHIHNNITSSGHPSFSHFTCHISSADQSQPEWGGMLKKVSCATADFAGLALLEDLIHETSHKNESALELELIL